MKIVARQRGAVRGALPAFGVTLLVLFALTPGVRAAGFLGLAGNYAVFGLYTNASATTGTYLNLANVTVNGDVAEGPYGTGHVFAASLVNGTYFYDTMATYPDLDGPHLVTGGVSQASLAQANADALSAYNDATSRPPTQTFGSITTSQTVYGNGGLNVISIADINLGSGEHLVFSGGSNDFFIVNVTGGLTMGGNGSIGGGGSVDASNILLNFIGAGSKLTSHVDNIVNGTILAPYRSVEFHSANGSILAGGAEIKLMSDCRIKHITLVPEPSSLLAMAGSIASLIALARRRK